MCVIYRKRHTIRSRLRLAEQLALRRAGIKKSQLSELSPRLIHSLTRIPLSRAKELSALIQFENCTSVGPSTAQDLWNLGYRSLKDLQDEDPTEIYERLCRQVGNRVDPCLLDVFRSIIAQAKNPNLPVDQRNWWYWTPHRRDAGRSVSLRLLRPRKGARL